ncbi:hypothetical protein SAMN02787142_0578 [Burkholderia sp. WP9]|nr:hypothetical protein SAMN02787142_0578 [Burkholderia sp. WP9]
MTIGPVIDEAFRTHFTIGPSAYALLISLKGTHDSRRLVVQVLRVGSRAAA